MAYTPTTWANGDTITAAGLNKMEQGIAAGGLPAVTSSDNGDVLTVVNGAWDKAKSSVLVVHLDPNTFEADASWQDIHDAGFAVLYMDAPDVGVMVHLLTVINNSDGYFCSFEWKSQGLSNEIALFAENATDNMMLD